MAFVWVAKLDAVPPNSVMEVMVGGEPYAICNDAGTVAAISGVCLHRGGPLGQGQLHDGRIVCPYHMWELDCRTGAYDYDPSQRVATYEVLVENGDILLQIS